ncbi:MAG: nucleoside/nucleotide kinase family protein [Pseudomonadota bacterium]
MRDPIPELAARVRALRPKGRRALVAIAGPPASGKSTLAVELAAALGPGALAVPMDGFHLDDSVLEVRGLRDRKGSPPSFDAIGFVHAMRRLAQEPEVVLPVFDRSREISIAGALAVGPDCEIAVVEGNYLCFDEAPWRDLMTLWDLSVFIDTPEEVLRERLVVRWQTHGRADAAEWIETNDLPNIRLVQTNRLPVDLSLYEE